MRTIPRSPAVAKNNGRLAAALLLLLVIAAAAASAGATPGKAEPSGSTAIPADASKVHHDTAEMQLMICTKQTVTPALCTRSTAMHVSAQHDTGACCVAVERVFKCDVPAGCIRLQCVAALQAIMQPVGVLWACRESVASVQLPATLQSRPILPFY
jgi:hypothetical protein